MAVLNRLSTERDDLIDDLFRWRKLIARQAKRRFHDERVSPARFRRLGRFAPTQFEIAGVKQRLTVSEK